MFKHAVYLTVHFQSIHIMHWYALGTTTFSAVVHLKYTYELNDRYLDSYHKFINICIYMNDCNYVEYWKYFGIEKSNEYCWKCIFQVMINIYIFASAYNPVFTSSFMTDFDKLKASSNENLVFGDPFT